MMYVLCASDLFSGTFSNLYFFENINGNDVLVENVTLSDGVDIKNFSVHIPFNVSCNDIIGS